jgi:protein phosphatase 1 regulatory subunit 11
MAQGSMGSQTQTETNTPADSGGEGETTAVLRLRGAPEPMARARVQWAEDVVDNEGLRRKSSKGMSSTIYDFP